MSTAQRDEAKAHVHNGARYLLSPLSFPCIQSPHLFEQEPTHPMDEGRDGVKTDGTTAPLLIVMCHPVDSVLHGA